MSKKMLMQIWLTLVSGFVLGAALASFVMSRAGEGVLFLALGSLLMAQAGQYD